MSDDFLIRNLTPKPEGCLLSLAEAIGWYEAAAVQLGAGVLVEDFVCLAAAVAKLKDEFYLAVEASNENPIDLLRDVHPTGPVGFAGYWSESYAAICSDIVWDLCDEMPVGDWYRNVNSAWPFGDQISGSPEFKWESFQVSRSYWQNLPEGEVEWEDLQISQSDWQNLAEEVAHHCARQDERPVNGNKLRALIQWELKLLAGEKRDKQDSKQDNKKNFPENPAVRRFIRVLQKEVANGGLERGRKTDIANEIEAETGVPAGTLLRQVNRYSHLWKPDK